MGMECEFIAHGIFASSECIFHKHYLIDNKTNTKSIPKERFHEGLLYFSEIK